MKKISHVIACVSASLAISTAALAAPTAATCPSLSAKYNNPNYVNQFVEFGVATDADVQSRVNNAWNKLFAATAENNRGTTSILYNTPTGNMSYILDVGNNDIRSEGMSYGLMIAVQMNQKETFNKLWNFAITYMLQKSGGEPTRFAWRVNPTTPYGLVNGDTGAAPDGEEYLEMAMWFAHHRWGSIDPATGANFSDTNQDYRNYRYWAWKLQEILKSNTFSDTAQYKIRFVPNSSYTDPSYHLPAFYEMWALWTGGVVVSNGPDTTNYWRYAADASRTFLNTHISNNRTSFSAPLTSDYANFNGTRVADGTNGNNNASYYAHDSWRVISNMAVDYNWCSGDATMKSLVKEQLTWFAANGAHDVYKFGAGGWADQNNSEGAVAMNAVGSLAMNKADSTENTLAKNALTSLYNIQNPPSGQWRYYNGLLYTMGLLHTAGKFNIYSWWWNAYYMNPSAAFVYDNSMANNSKAEPRLSITNKTSSALSNPKAKYYFTAENGKTPVLEGVASSNFTASLVQEDNTLWSVTMNYAGKTLQPNQKLPATGYDTFTIRYSDNSAFDKSNDFSQPVSGSAYNTSNRIPVYTSAGVRVLGDEPVKGGISYNAVLKSFPSNMVVTATSAANDADAKAQPLTGEWNTQTWTVEPVTGTTYVRLKNLGRYLKAQSTAEAARVVTYDYAAGSTFEMWSLESAGPKKYLLKNVGSGKYLTVLDGSTYSALYSQGYNPNWPTQVWTLQ